MDSPTESTTAPRRPSSPLSPIAAQQRYERQTIRLAHRRMLQGRFKEALAVANEFLRQQLADDWKGPLSYFQTTVELIAPLQLESISECWGGAEAANDATLTFQIRLGTQLKAVDELAVIALQCWHELSVRDSSHNQKNLTKRAECVWVHLQPVLQIYDKHPMPIQVFVEVWLPFWLHQASSSPSSTSLSLAWNWQVCALLVERTQRGPSDLLLGQWLDQSLYTLFTAQLPRISKVSLATELALAVLYPKSSTTTITSSSSSSSSSAWESLLSQLKNDATFAANTQPQPRTIQAIGRILIDYRGQDHQSPEEKKSEFDESSSSGFATSTSRNGVSRLDCLDQILNHPCYRDIHIRFNNSSTTGNALTRPPMARENGILHRNLSPRRHHSSNAYAWLSQRVQNALQQSLVPLSTKSWVRSLLGLQDMSIQQLQQQQQQQYSQGQRRSTSSVLWKKSGYLGLSLASILFLVYRHRKVLAKKIATPLLIALCSPVLELMDVLLPNSANHLRQWMTTTSSNRMTQSSMQEQS